MNFGFMKKIELNHDIKNLVKFEIDIEYFGFVIQFSICRDI